LYIFTYTYYYIYLQLLTNCKTTQLSSFTQHLVLISPRNQLSPQSLNIFPDPLSTPSRTKSNRRRHFSGHPRSLPAPLFLELGHGRWMSAHCQLFLRWNSAQRTKGGRSGLSWIRRRPSLRPPDENRMLKWLEGTDRGQEP
jgi:hypothetical protein